MKKLRIVLSVLAVTLAVGAAYSSELLTPPTIVDGFEYVQNGDPECVRHRDACQDDGKIECRLGVSGPILRDSEIAPCGDNLWKIGSEQD